MRTSLLPNYADDSDKPAVRTVKTKMLRSALVVLTTPPFKLCIPTYWFRERESIPANQRRPQQVSAPHPKIKSYATALNALSPSLNALVNSGLVNVVHKV